MKNFNQCEAAGKRAAKEFSLNLNHLLNMTIVAIRDMQDEDVEGSDFDAVKVCWIRTELDAETRALLAEIGQPATRDGLRPALVRGGIETKGMQPNQSLHRDDLQDIRCICIQLGQWTGKKKGPKGYDVYSRNKHGWLRRVFQPEWKPSSAEPMILEFVLECWDDHGGKRPYASIAFTDFPALKRRIVAYGKENGLDLTNWESIPVGKAAENFACGDLIYRDNVWFVPLDLLVDIAEIVIIGDAPRFYKNGKCI